jgi:hypothetical protein
MKTTFNVDDLKVISRLERYKDDGIFHDIIADLIALHEEVERLSAFLPEDPQLIDIRWGFDANGSPVEYKVYL